MNSAHKYYSYDYYYGDNCDDGDYDIAIPVITMLGLLVEIRVIARNIAKNIGITIGKGIVRIKKPGTANVIPAIN